MNNPSAQRYKLRLLTFNLWHGLNHSRPWLMAPAENPWEAWCRKQARLRGLKAQLFPKSYQESFGGELLEVFLLQESNPVSRAGQILKKKLQMDGEVNFPVNVGVRVGNLSYPPFLQEGLSTLWRGNLQNVRSDNKFLSGVGFDFQAPGKTLISFHATERRGAMMLQGEWAGRRVTFVNLHLHSGRTAKNSALRRSSEIDSLMDWLQPEFQRSDAIFVAGDFNCEHGEAELSTMVAKGFKEFLPPSGEPVYTWDPVGNKLCKKVAELSPQPEHLAWDRQQHQLDHIYYWWKTASWGKKPNAQAPWTVKLSRVFDNDQYGTWVSDHCGILVDISWDEGSI